MSLRHRLAVLALSGLLVAAPPVAAQLGGPPKSVLSASLELKPAVPATGQAFQATVVLRIEPGWHVNSHVPKEDYLIPTEVSIAKAEGLTFSAPAYPPHVERKFSFSDSKVAVYEDVTRISISGQVSPQARPGKRSLVATVSYQACNDQQCLAPTSAEARLEVDLVKGAAAPPAEATTSASPASSSVAPAATPASTSAGSAPEPSAAATATTTAATPPVPAGASAASPALGAAELRERWAVKGVPTILFLGPDGKELGDRVVGFEPPDAFLRHVEGQAGGAAGSGGSFPLFLVFLSGLALNLTPCVYPVIPITLGFFGRQNSGRTSRTFAMALVYVLGMCATYSALGVFAALSGSLFGAWLQKPIVLAVVALVVVALALSMFGLYEIQAPAALQDRASGKKGYLGALTMGLFVGFVAAPCIGPFVLSLLTFVAQQGSALLGFVYFFTLSLGLGLPYLVLGTLSGSLQKLPKSGEWMVSIRKVFGFLLLSLAVYFLRALLPERVFQIGIAVPLLVGGLWFLFFEKTAPTGWFRHVRTVIALGLLAAGTVFALPTRPVEALRFQPYSEQALNAARAAGKPVMIDFYADWCLPCKELDHKTFTDPTVIKKLDGWVLLKADLTK